MLLRIGNGVGNQGYGNRPPIDNRNPVRKFSIDPLRLQNQWDNSASTDSPRQRIKEKSRYGNSVSTPRRRYGHRLRNPFLRTPFPRLLVLERYFRKSCTVEINAIMGSFMVNAQGEGTADKDKPLATSPKLRLQLWQTHGL